MTGASKLVQAEAVRYLHHEAAADAWVDEVVSASTTHASSEREGRMEGRGLTRAFAAGIDGAAAAVAAVATGAAALGIEHV